MRRHCNIYKSVIRKAKKSHRKQVSNLILSAKHNNSKEFWSFINGKKPKSEIPISAEELKTHFAKLSVGSTDDEERYKEFEMLMNNFRDDDVTNSVLNHNFTVDELNKVIKKLKTGKAAGPDGIKNEVIIHTFEKLQNFWCKLFNHIFESGEIPTEWLNGLIVPIYKNKGEKTDPGNYRGITLLSCSAKFFTAVLNERLRQFSDICNILLKNQAGFRPDHSTTDHIFVLKTLSDLIRHRKRKLFCAFVDYEKAFDKVWHLGLWTKLLRYGIGGKLILVLVNMYKGITSCISANQSISTPFSIHQGVRQGENLSPFLFALYVNDLEDFLKKEKGCTPVDLEIGFDDRISEYLKILLILYADDTVIFADSEINLQKALDGLELYCKKWRLSINCSKTKVMVFCGKKPTHQYPFSLNDQTLEHVSSFKYLGVTFNFNGNFNLCVKQLKEQGRRAMFALLQKCRYLQLPISVQLELFNSLVRPIITYSCEVWGYKCIDIAESLQLEFCKYILHMKKSTPTCFVYGESGHFPLYLHVYSRMVKFWHKLMLDGEYKMSSSMLKTLHECFQFNVYKSEWLTKIKQILDDYGLSFVWNFPQSVSTKWLDRILNLRMKDVYIQTWSQECREHSKTFNYSLFKTKFGIEYYLDVLPNSYRIAMTRIRTNNHKLPIEKGRYSSLPRDLRHCNICNSDLPGDEYHFLLECPTLTNLREKYLPKYFRTNPNFFKYSELISITSKKKLLNLSKFVHEGLQMFK